MTNSDAHRSADEHQDSVAVEGEVNPTGTDSRNASPQCRLCRGRGYVSTGPYIMDNKLCPCVILEQNRRAADRFITDHFSKRSRHMTFSRFQTGGDARNEKALRIARNFVDDWNSDVRPEGWVLGFTGVPQSGKTHLATAVALALVKRYGVKAAVLNVPDMFRQEKERFNRDRNAKPAASLVQQAIDAEFLVLDELGADRHVGDPSSISYVQEQLYIILDQRIMEMRPMIYTTNLTVEQMTNALTLGGGTDDRVNERLIMGQRIISRIERAAVIPAIELERVPGLDRGNSRAAERLKRAR